MIDLFKKGNSELIFLFIVSSINHDSLVCTKCNPKVKKVLGAYRLQTEFGTFTTNSNALFEFQHYKVYSEDKIWHIYYKIKCASNFSTTRHILQTEFDTFTYYKCNESLFHCNFSIIFFNWPAGREAPGSAKPFHWCVQLAQPNEICIY